MRGQNRLEPGKGTSPTLCLRVADTQRQALDDLCERTGRALSDVVREALDAYLAGLGIAPDRATRGAA
jgi:predicted DNA-binding protein